MLTQTQSFFCRMDQRYGAMGVLKFFACRIHCEQLFDAKVRGGVWPVFGDTRTNRG